MHSQTYLASIPFVIPTVHFFLLLWSLDEQRRHSTTFNILDFRQFYLNVILQKVSPRKT